jgi:hypothetical protein
MEPKCTGCGETLTAKPVCERCNTVAAGGQHAVIVRPAELSAPAACSCCLRPDPEHFVQLQGGKLGSGGIPICRDCTGTHAKFLSTMNLLTLGALVVVGAVVFLAWPEARAFTWPLSKPTTAGLLLSGVVAATFAIIVGFGVVRKRPPYRRRGHVQNCRAAKSRPDGSVELANKAFAELARRQKA